MFVQKATFDDLLREILSRVASDGEKIKASRGHTRELYGVQLELSNPRARLSLTESRGKIFSCLGELFWYLSGTGSLEFIKYYIKEYAKDSEDGATIHGAYGPRLFDARGINQLQNVIELLKAKPRTRRAVIQIFDAADNARTRKEVPCTSTLQFVMPDNKLSLIVNMRSNDALFGLPHDVFAFTMVQEIVARSIGAEIGKYVHFVGSMHLYEDKIEMVDEYLREGFQDFTSAMPPMPIGDPWPMIAALKEVESLVRKDGKLPKTIGEMDPYWQDLALMFLAFSASKKHNEVQLREVAGRMHSEVYSQYIEAKIEAASARSGYQAHLNLD